MNTKFIDLAFKIASDMPDYGLRAKTAAIITRRNNIISVGTNKKKSHPLQKRYSRNIYKIYLHAETLAIINAIRDGNSLEGTTLWVVRSRNKSRSGIGIEREMAISLPCIGCQRALISFGIKRVFYIDRKGEVQEIKL